MLDQSSEFGEVSVDGLEDAHVDEHAFPPQSTQDLQSPRLRGGWAFSEGQSSFTALFYLILSLHLPRFGGEVTGATSSCSLSWPEAYSPPIGHTSQQYRRKQEACREYCLPREPHGIILREVMEDHNVADDDGCVRNDDLGSPNSTFEAQQDAGDERQEPDRNAHGSTCRWARALTRPLTRKHQCTNQANSQADQQERTA